MGRCFFTADQTLEPQERQWDVGVDNNDFYPVSFEWLRKKLELGEERARACKYSSCI